MLYGFPGYNIIRRMQSIGKLENMLYNGKKSLIRFDIISVESTIALAESISDQLLRGVWDSKSVYSRTYY